MSKKEDLILKLKSILADQRELEKFIIDNSNLPGPRSNYKLAFAFDETVVI